MLPDKSLSHSIRDHAHHYSFMFGLCNENETNSSHISFHFVSTVLHNNSYLRQLLCFRQYQGETFVLTFLGTSRAMNRILPILFKSSEIDWSPLGLSRRLMPWSVVSHLGSTFACFSGNEVFSCLTLFVTLQSLSMRPLSAVKH